MYFAVSCFIGGINVSRNFITLINAVFMTCVSVSSCHYVLRVVVPRCDLLFCFYRSQQAVGSWIPVVALKIN